MTDTSLGFTRQDFKTRAWHTLLNGNFTLLDAMLNNTYAGDPNTHVRGYWVGQPCLDSTNDVPYICSVPGVDAAGTTWVRLDSLTTTEAIIMTALGATAFGKSIYQAADAPTARVLLGARGLPVSAAPRATNYTIVAGDLGLILPFDATSGSLVVTAPNADALYNGWYVELERIDSVVANTITVIQDGNDELNGASTVLLSKQWQFARLSVDEAGKFRVETIVQPTINELLPSQTANAGKIYSTDGTNAAWKLLTPSVRKIKWTSAGDWDKLDGLVSTFVQVISGGGGGARAQATQTFTCGGPGIYNEGTYAEADLGSTEAVVVGAAGTGRVTSTGDGTDGGTSSFGSHISCTGGSRGRQNNGSNSITEGTATGGDLARSGRNFGLSTSGFELEGRGFDLSPYGFGGSIANGVTSAALGYGASGAGNEAANASNGAPGLVLTTDTIITLT